MVQIKVYALRATIEAHRSGLSEAIHESVMEEFGYPKEKRFQRFIALEPEDFVRPGDRSDRYTVIEITLFETSRSNWGVRDMPGDELAIGYDVDV